MILLVLFWIKYAIALISLSENYSLSMEPIKTSSIFFVFIFAARGLDQVAEKVLSYLDANSLKNAEVVCKEWYRVISEGMLWRKLIQKKVRSDPLWLGLSERRGWYVYQKSL